MHCNYCTGVNKHEAYYLCVDYSVFDILLAKNKHCEPNGPRVSPAIFKHVGQVPYSRGFKFGEKGPIKILAYFCLKVRRC